MKTLWFDSRPIFTNGGTGGRIGIAEQVTSNKADATF